MKSDAIHVTLNSAVGPWPMTSEAIDKKVAAIITSKLQTDIASRQKTLPKNKNPEKTPQFRVNPYNFYPF